MLKCYNHLLENNHLDTKYLIGVQHRNSDSRSNSINIRVYLTE